MLALPPAITMKELSESKTSPSTTTAPSSRSKVSRFREGQKIESGSKISPFSTGRPKPISSDLIGNPRVKTSILPSKPGLSGHDHEALAKDLKRRLDGSESLVKEMNFEISSLKEDIEKLKRLNIELEAQKKKLVNDLSAAEVKIAALDRFRQVASAGKGEPSELTIQKHNANKLDHYTGNKKLEKESINSIKQLLPLNPGPKPVEAKVLQSISGLNVTPPSPPPPPPPPCLLPKRESKVQNATALVEFYHSLNKRDIKGNTNCSSPAASSAHNSIVGELQNRSTHLLAIKADVETKRELINHLINKVQHAAYNNMDDVLTFVDWVDAELSKLADERAVLKHFKWPERKADALREAAVEYRDIKQLYAEASTFTDHGSLTCEAFLRKIAVLVERSERSVHRLIKLRGMSMVAYQECKIPTDWMLDSGMISMIKHASMKLAKFYIKRVLTELEFSWQIEMGSAQESLVSQGVRFAYRVYQFVGGLDSETMRAFEELRSRVQWRESREVMQGISLH